jgi:hypothetical protein
LAAGILPCVSYDLVFWKSAGPAADPAATYDRLANREHAEGIEELPIEQFLHALAGAFPGSVREPNGSDEWQIWDAPDGSRGFETWWSPFHVETFCRGLTDDEMNRIIDVALSFHCRLFDPQTNERFEG